MISTSLLSPFLGTTLDATNYANIGTRYAGKVRDVYTSGDRVILISTDRQNSTTGVPLIVASVRMERKMELLRSGPRCEPCFWVYA